MFLMMFVGSGFLIQKFKPIPRTEVSPGVGFPKSSRLWSCRLSGRVKYSELVMLDIVLIRLCFVDKAISATNPCKR